MVGLRKTIAELSFSPASVEKIAVQARQVRQQQRLYGWSLIPLGLLTIAAGAIMLSAPATESAPQTPSDINRPAATANSQLTTSLKADRASAAAGDSVTWRLTITNRSAESQTDDIYFLTSDINQYAYTTHASEGGIVHERQNYITWPDLTIAANSSAQLLVTTRVNSPVPSTASSRSQPERHDCVMSANFGNPATVAINCSPFKQLELLIQRGPTLSHLVAFILSLILLIAALIGNLSLRLQSKELRIIRRQLNTGSLA